MRSDVTLLCGGFPCTDLSVAGKRAGLAGDASGLFWEFARVADLVRPEWLLLENVPGLLSSHGGRDFLVLLHALADIGRGDGVGYGVAYRVADSRYFGVPQRRRRVFIVGARADGDPRAAAERASKVLAVGSRCSRHPATRSKARENDPAGSVSGTLGGRRGFTGDDIDRGGHTSLSGIGNDGPDDNDAQAGRLVAWSVTLASDPISAKELAQPSTKRNGDPGVVALVAAPLTAGGHPNSNMPGRRKEDDENLVAFHATQDPISGSVTPAMDSEPSGADGTAVRRLTPLECERLQSLPDGWTLIDGASDSQRYSAIGDAVTASVSEWLGRRILEAS